MYCIVFFEIGIFPCGRACFYYVDHGLDYLGVGFNIYIHIYIYMCLYIYKYIYIFFYVDHGLDQLGVGLKKK